MDKQTIIGFVLIAAVLMVWMWTNSPKPGEHIPTPDTLVTKAIPAKRDTIPPPVKPRELADTDTLGSTFAPLVGGGEKILIVKTALYTAEVTTRGGLLRKWELSNYKTWNGYPVQMVSPDHGGNYSLLFTTKEGKLVNTRSLQFDASFRPWEKIELEGEDSLIVDLVLNVSASSRIVKRLVFRNGRYTLESRFEFVNMQDIIANYEYAITWENGIPYAEHNSVNESGFSHAYAFAGGEKTELDASDAGVKVEEKFNGDVDWLAIRNKYFAVALIPKQNGNNGFELEGINTPQENHGVRKEYSVFLKMPFKGNSQQSETMAVFLGPLDMDVIRPLNRNLEKIISLGAAWVIRPIAEYILLPVFGFLKSLIPNFGIVIIVFSILIKVALNPLSKTSMKSMKKMQALQPMMEEIRAKYKDDQQKTNQQIMSLYKDYGVNPASGCLPLILQMPILYALYSIFSSSIELRQATFFGWITDLSIPDILFTLPFKIPFFGINEFSGLALAMGLTMFIQQKMTVTDPRQKMMVWMMPLMLTLLFNSFPSGLNLYYFVFNLLSIGQQYLTNKDIAKEPLKKVDPQKRKEGFLERLAKNVPKVK